MTFGEAIAVDDFGNAYVTGLTYSSDFPTVNPFQSTLNGDKSDAFVTRIKADGSALLYSSYLGGSNFDFGLGIAVDPSRNAYIVGITTPTNNPISLDGYDAFVAKVALALAAQIHQPINSDGSSVFSANKGVVPVKFTLSVDNVATCDLPAASIVVTRTSGGSPGIIDESVYQGPSDTGANFRISDCQYVYNLSAKSLGTGSYRVDIVIGARVVGNAVFGLK